ncbi:MAG: 1-phosphofructokinase family hexose kinase [Corynebacterium sp.]|nr:1-phosphofructokinase family hexose kinase [Corynebacterium sp.]
MIYTLTPNPSIDTTLVLNTTLARGEVQRLDHSESVAGGKGVNVALALHKAGSAATAIFPARPQDPFVQLVADTKLPYEAVHAGENPQRVRVNTAVTEPDGTTTKLNDKGAEVTTELQTAIENTVVAAAPQADWLVLAGSLPPGVPVDWYATLVRLAKQANPQLRVAVDTSDAPLVNLCIAVHAGDASNAPHLVKPNGMELGQVVGVDGTRLEDEAAKGNFEPTLEAARKLLQRGIESALVTLGGAGALYVTADHAWHATPPPAKIQSTVGAGDCTLAGFILAQQHCLDEAASLQQAVAYGTAAASLPGTTIPEPGQVNIAGTAVRSID